MSFFTLTCPWCGTTFTTGMVGMSMVGSGHKCEKRISCEEPGCRRNSVVQVAMPDGMTFRCIAHIDGGVCGQWQTTGER